MEEKETLTVKDAENAQRGILELVLSYPGYPDTFQADNSTVKWNSAETDSSIGLYPMQGAMYIKKYVSGSYVAQMPFQMTFKSSPTTNLANLDAQEMLTALADWLEQSDIDFKDGSD